jgi:excisionase family DNA binding protein
VSEPCAYLRAREIAERLGLSERTIRRLIADRTLPSIKIGGARLVAEADLERALVAATKVEAMVDDTDATSEGIQRFTQVS